jgi:hypothetical protein
MKNIKGGSQENKKIFHETIKMAQYMLTQHKTVMSRRR